MAPSSLKLGHTREDAKLLRKIDLRLIPILTLLYLLSLLDRTNIGNRIVGLAEDINLSPPAYNTALALYFVAYVIFEVPANIILKRFDPQIWLPTLTLAWGIASVGQGLITNQAGLLGVRFLLGVTEAGLFPGVIFLFSVYYRRRERSWRVAIFFGGAALAGAFGGILAFGFGKMDGVGGRHGWAWIFIIEGILTIAVSLGAYFLVPTWSHKAKFLTEEERSRLLAILKEDSDAGSEEKFEWYYVRQAFTDHLVWGYALLFHGFAFVLYSLSLFMPSIISGLGFKSWQAQLMTVPPNALASVSIWLTVWASARYNLRAPFIIGAGVVAIIGYIRVYLHLVSIQMSGRNACSSQLMRVSKVTASGAPFWTSICGSMILMGQKLLYFGRKKSFRYHLQIHSIILITAKNAGGQYVGVHFAAVGIYVGNALLLSWPSENVSGQTKRAIAVAMQITIRDTGAIAGVLIYRPNFSGHRYRKPHIISIGYLVFAIVITAYLWVSMSRENKRRDALDANNVGDGKEKIASIEVDVTDAEKLRLGD